jgi:hypothetical protein
MDARGSLDDVEKKISGSTGIRITDRPGGSLGTTMAVVSPLPYKIYMH